MTREEAEGILKSKDDPAGRWNSNRSSNAPIPKLDGIDLSGCALKGVDFSNCSMVGCVFDGADLTEARFESARLNAGTFKDAKLQRANFFRANLAVANFDGCVAEDALFKDSLAGQTQFKGANLARAKFENAQLVGARFLDCDLRGTYFWKARVSNADFGQSRVDKATNLEQMEVEWCRIHRFTLESLVNYGGLTNGDLMQMIIVDDVAKLRASFSGILRWLHLVSLLVFVVPYAYFLIHQWTMARFIPGDDATGVTLWEALLRYIWNGGVNWKSGFHLNLYPFGAFVVSVVYNIGRGILIWKASILEHYQEVTHLPARFTLKGPWKWLLLGVKFFFWVNLLVVAYHSFHFLSQRIPV